MLRQWVLPLAFHYQKYQAVEKCQSCSVVLQDALNEKTKTWVVISFK
ncbi:9387_t:CDS:2, partial [Racocetra fulgida]